MDQMKIRLKLLEQLDAGHQDQRGEDDPCRAVFDSVLSDGYIATKILFGASPSAATALRSETAFGAEFRFSATAE
jgi:hypothetical protein